jgi:hypothetical protein
MYIVRTNAERVMCVSTRERMQLVHRRGNVDNLANAYVFSGPTHFVGAGEWGLTCIWIRSRVNV